MNMHRRLRSGATRSLVALALAVPVLAGAPYAAAATPHQDAVQIQGRQRTFLVYTPKAGGRSDRLPILLMLHGGLGNGSHAVRQTGLADYVDRVGMLAVFPDFGGQQWNDGRETTEDGVDNVAFLRSVIAKTAQTWGGDPSRVYVAGGSNGGMMAQRMACEAADAITAVGIVIANMPQRLAQRCRPSRPLPVLMINATQDPIMPWNGGEIASSQMLGAGGTVVSTLDTFKLWSTLDGCPGPRVSNLAGIPVRRYSATGCRLDSQVVLYEIDGGGHGWPGGRYAQGPFAREILGDVNNDINASQLLVQFFKQYGL